MDTMMMKTNRLLLRPFSVSDAEQASYNSRCNSVSEAMSDMVMQDTTKATEWINWINRIANVEEPWEILAIELMGTCKCIGLVGVIPQQKIQGEVEILFAIADEYQNNGYATEAAKAIIQWFFNTRDQSYLCAIVKISNLSSQKVVEKLGFHIFQEILYFYNSFFQKLLIQYLYF